MQADDLGTIEVGKKADLILLDLNAPHLSPTANLPKTIATVAGPADVRDVIIDGKIIIRERAFTSLDEVEIRARAAEALRSISKKAGLNTQYGYFSNQARSE